MTVIEAINTGTTERRRVADIARDLGVIFAQRACETTDEDKFVATIDELAAMLRTLGYHCGSTALAFSMHTHQVAVPAWRWTHQKATAVEPLLKRIATERIQLVSSGGSDWLAGSGKAGR